jgi:Mitochondrial protein Pet127
MPLQKQFKDAYICLGCALKLNKRSFSSSLKSSNSTPASQPSEDPSSFVNQYLQSVRNQQPNPLLAAKEYRFDQNGTSSPPHAKVEAQHNIAAESQEVQKSTKFTVGPRLLGTQLESIALLSKVVKKLSKASKPTTSVQDAVKHIVKTKRPRDETQCMETLGKVYSEGTLEDVWRDLAILEKLDRRKNVDAPTEHLVAALTRKGLLKASYDSLWNRDALPDCSVSTAPGEDQTLPSAAATTSTDGTSGKAPAREVRRLRNETKIRRVELKEAAPPKFTSTVEANTLSVSQLPRIGPAVPNLSHDLSRVLFNPGIYQLQDPRSRVYNFSPYLESIMPVSEFDFKVLKEYITSSRDDTLRSLALQHGKKYVGSSSSMTSTLGQFHFLLSQWRDINTEALSRGFSDTMKSFTIIQRSPSSVFLRYQDGVYAMDADKEYDSGNILMSLGKSMEKLLTQSPGGYERYRKTSVVKIPEEERKAPEAYQYTHAGDFLMRAQLDAYDSRLPGTGTFDLKTRAVASIRHNIKQHEEGFGYQIKTRFGDWESYEREYFDMMRSAFLKYSLQVRLGQMDGIFVAFHNVERIFGFQYISLPEMDMALHGQYDTTLGDQEFKFSVELLNQVLNRVTERFPNRSLRLQFETRDLPAGGIFMNIFAEPMDESTIEAIQTSKKEAVDAFEQRLMNPENSPGPESTDDLEGRDEQLSNGPTIGQASISPTVLPESREPTEQVAEGPSIERSACDDGNVQEVEQMPIDGQTSSEIPTEASSTVQDAKLPEKPTPTTELLALKLRIQNKVNGKTVDRPIHLTSTDTWSLDYSIEEEMRETSAQSQYRASKARRKTVLDEREENTATNYYLRRLREMTLSGAEWRKAQDELDAGRKKVVLYEDRESRSSDI